MPQQAGTYLPLPSTHLSSHTHICTKHVKTAGISRACTACVAYMMMVEKMSCNAAFSKIHHVRGQVQPNGAFWRQLRDLESVLLERGTVLRELRPNELEPIPDAAPAPAPSAGAAAADGGSTVTGGAARGNVDGGRQKAKAKGKRGMAFTTSGSNEEDVGDAILNLDAAASALESFVSVALTARIELHQS